MVWNFRKFPENAFSQANTNRLLLIFNVGVIRVV